MSDATLDRGVKVILPISGKIGDDLTCSHMHLKAVDCEVANFNLTLTSAHVDREFHRYVVG